MKLNSDDILKTIENAVIQEKQKGQQVVSIDALLNFTQSIRGQMGTPQDPPIDLVIITTQWKNENDRNIAQYNAQSASALEMFKSVIAYGQLTLKSSLLINGGAAVAMLAFISNLWGKVSEPLAIYHLAKALTMFASGVLSAGIAIGVTYLTQCGYEREGINNTYKFLARAAHLLALIITITSFGLFALGICQAYEAIMITLLKSK